MDDEEQEGIMREAQRNLAAWQHKVRGARARAALATLPLHPPSRHARAVVKPASTRMTAACLLMIMRPLPPARCVPHAPAGLL